MALFELIFRSFWTWLGSMIMLYVIVHALTFIANRILRHWTIRKHGYPPPYCDADGDFRPIKKEDISQNS